MFEFSGSLFSRQSLRSLCFLCRQLRYQRILIRSQRHFWTKTGIISNQCERRQRHSENLIPKAKEFRRSDTSYVSPSGVSFLFDTHKLVTKLQDNGFSVQQAESITSCLVETVGCSTESITANTVSKLEQERLEMRIQASVEGVKHEMFLLEKSKFAEIKDETEKLKDKVKGLEHLLQEEFLKLKSGVRLDLSLEKSRTSEELALRDQRIKDNGNKIETEIAKLGTQMESQKLDLIKYLVGSMVSCTTLILAFWRFVKS